MKCVVPQIPDYEKLCEVAKRLPAMDPQAVVTTATVHAVGTELAAAMNASLTQYGISEGRLRVLSRLMLHDGPVTPSELAECGGVSKGTITGLIDGLERDGFVRRQSSEQDRRVTHVALTPAGQASLDRILPDHLSRLSRLMSGLSKPEQETLVGLLLKVYRGLPALRSEPRDAIQPGESH